MVMVFQNHYQRRRMYTRIALGKNRTMDVVGGEASGGSGTLLILYPAVFGLQICQVVIGAPLVVSTGAWGTTCITNMTADVYFF